MPKQSILLARISADELIIQTSRNQKKPDACGMKISRANTWSCQPSAISFQTLREARRHCLIRAS